MYIIIISPFLLLLFCFCFFLLLLAMVEHWGSTEDEQQGETYHSKVNMLPACVLPVLFYTLAEHLHAFHVEPKEAQLSNSLKLYRLPLIAFYLKSCSFQKNEEQRGRQTKKYTCADNRNKKQTKEPDKRSAFQARFVQFWWKDLCWLCTFLMGVSGKSHDVLLYFLNHRSRDN